MLDRSLLRGQGEGGSGHSRRGAGDIPAHPGLPCGVALSQAEKEAGGDCGI